MKSFTRPQLTVFNQSFEFGYYGLVVDLYGMTLIAGHFVAVGEHSQVFAEEFQCPVRDMAFVCPSPVGWPVRSNTGPACIDRWAFSQSALITMSAVISVRSERLARAWVILAAMLGFLRFSKPIWPQSE